MRKIWSKCATDERGVSAMETALIVALIAIVAVGGLRSVGSSVGGGDDLDQASEALGEEVVDINSDTADSPRAGSGAGGSSGAFGSAAGGVVGTGDQSGGGFDIDYDDGGWNTHRAGQSFGEWTVESGTVDVKVDARRGFDYGGTGNVIDMNGSRYAGRISRTYNVVPNVAYNLSVDVGENTYGGAAAKMLAIEWNGERISTLSIDLPQNTFKTFTVQIPPSPTGEATLTFQSLIDNSSYGPVIDDPTVVLVPRR
ncbi:MAG: hypothetical protein AAGD35_15085 [Actinomycetota bacterium]